MKLPRAIGPNPIGTKKIISCLTCDGEGIIIKENTHITCPDCDGKGTIEGIVTRL